MVQRPHENVKSIRQAVFKLPRSQAISCIWYNINLQTAVAAILILVEWPKSISSEVSRAGSRPMQSMHMHRSEKIADAFIGQIFTANNKKHHFLRKHTAYNAKIPTKLLFPRNEYDTYSKFTSKRFVFPKTYPRTITLTFPPLIYIAMFQNLLFNNVNIKIFILDFVYVFESACI